MLPVKLLRKEKELRSSELKIARLNIFPKDEVTHNWKLHLTDVSSSARVTSLRFFSPPFTEMY